MTKLLAPLFLSLALAACGGGGDDDIPASADASHITLADAGVPEVPFGLGQLCDPENGKTCKDANGNDDPNMICGLFQGASIGFCTPVCFQGGWMQTAGSSTQGDGMTVEPNPDAAANSVCSTGYQGPAGSQQVCALFFPPQVPDPTMPPTMVDYGCAIICTAPEQCPGGLSCQPVPGAQVSICM